jgi:hypothetical protein
MTNSWDEMKRAKEEEYFNKLNQDALTRLQNRSSESPRLSPITGKPMEHVTIHGVVVDRCPTSGYIGLDAGELEQIITATQGEHKGWIDTFLKGLKK